jgi:hypothetical protein
MVPFRSLADRHGPIFEDTRPQPFYLHYVLDLWAQRWRRREATGDMIIFRVLVCRKIVPSSYCSRFDRRAGP